MNRAFSLDVTAAMLVSQNKEMVAMLVSQTKPLGIELYFYANTLFCFKKPIWPVVTCMKTLYNCFSIRLFQLTLSVQSMKLKDKTESLRGVFMNKFIKISHAWKKTIGCN